MLTIQIKLNAFFLIFKKRNHDRSIRFGPQKDWSRRHVLFDLARIYKFLEINVKLL